MNADKHFREVYLEKLSKKVQKVINSKTTKEINLNAYTDVKNYINERFSNVDFSGLHIYIAHPDAFSRAGFKYALGLYVHHLDIILIQLMSEHKKLNYKNVFEKSIAEQLDQDLTTPDVLVHEMMHAVSGRTGRSTRIYAHAEEEFAYTNTVPFYKNKGMSDEEIIKYYLTFCTNDIIGNHDELRDSLKGNDVLVEEYDSAVQKQKVMEFLNKHTTTICPIIIEKAKERAHLMIELYNKYGVQTVYTENVQNVSRFGDLDMDNDI